MTYKEIMLKKNQEVKTRHDQVLEQITVLERDLHTEDRYKDYFGALIERFSNLEDIFDLQISGKLRTLEIKELQELNLLMYRELYEENYSTSYANPAYSTEQFEEEVGRILCVLYSKIVDITVEAYRGNLEVLTIYEELLVDVLKSFKIDGVQVTKLKETVVNFQMQWDELLSSERINEFINTEYDFAREIVETADFGDLCYLYWYGMHVSSNELEMARFVNSIAKEELQAMADTYTEGYRIGFEITGKDIAKKKTAEVIYSLGLEPMVALALKNFEKIGLKSTISIGRIRTSKANRQYEFDHKSDAALYLTKEYVEHHIQVMSKVFEEIKERAYLYGGPAVIETFGEKDFDPMNKPEAYNYSAEQRELLVDQTSRLRQMQGKYIIESERSFTIIAYPVPEIGKDFEAIFKETVKLNTLDYKLYQNMQQKMIDVLDQAEYVHVLGKGENKTDVMVHMHQMKDPSKETNFENCVADVNIPVGEVFTSPQLKGTNGKLHVTKVYLNGLLFKNLEIEFKDGMIDQYTCTNFALEEENKKYMDENVLFNHKTLPIGEFAIGTNTTAYKMGIEYDIQAKLPILIAEKTGPHFAVGDTCYSHVEDVKVYNPDGKEIVARDNAVVNTRDTNPAEAYFNCHTDITIPYNELAQIVAISKEGKEITLIQDGKFTLPGVEELNRPLEALLK